MIHQLCSAGTSGLMVESAVNDAKPIAVSARSSEKIPATRMRHFTSDTKKTKTTPQLMNTMISKRLDQGGCWVMATSKGTPVSLTSCARSMAATSTSPASYQRKTMPTVCAMKPVAVTMVAKRRTFARFMVRLAMNKNSAPK